MKRRRERKKKKNSWRLWETACKPALVDWLGSAVEAQAPRDIVAWAIDKDLIDSNKASLGESELIPEFLEGLPYKSRLMRMNNEL